MNEYETIAEIIAEMRRGTRLPGYWRSCDVNAILQYHADRLDAAHRRERGNAAKLREALDESRRIASDLGGCRLNDYWKLNEIVRVCEAALAAPPRNCDCFKTAAEAIDAYQDLTGDQLATDSGMKEWVEFAVWLFAPATEKEGGAK